jgi:integrase
LLAAGQDPSAVRKAEKAAHANTFRGLVDEWLSKQTHWTDGTRVRNVRVINDLVKALRGNADQGISTVSAADLLEGLRRMEHRADTARRAARMAAQVCQYAVLTERLKYNPAVGLSSALEIPVVRHRPAITNPKRFGELFLLIDGYQGQPATRAALMLLALTFTRPGELRQAQWSEFDLDAAMWVIPAARMKGRKEHLVPLSTQALDVLQTLHPLTGRQPLVFPSLRPRRPLSDNTLALAVRSMGIPPTEHVPHGFRSSASSLLHEAGFDSQVIELQLAHSDKNKVRAAYNRSERLPERKELMQAWADLCVKMASEARR